MHFVARGSLVLTVSCWLNDMIAILQIVGGRRRYKCKNGVWWVGFITIALDDRSVGNIRIIIRGPATTSPYLSCVDELLAGRLILIG